jgi:hypothetical protein
VAPDVVLTAGHCFANELSVVVNGYSLSEQVNEDQYAREVGSSLRHPDFDSTTFDNDVMLLKLTSSVVSVDHAPLNFDDANPQNGDELTVMGLGDTAEDGSASNYLREVKVEVVDHDLCLANYEKIGLGHVREDIMLCAGAQEGNRDACQGDSGGPLIDGDEKIVGVVSWGVGCGRKDYPGVYARVSGLKEWLGTNICSLSDNRPDWCADINLAIHVDTTPVTPPQTPQPTLRQTPPPTSQPTSRPTLRPTESPTEAPSPAPTPLPTNNPTPRPTERPTKLPTAAPVTTGVVLTGVTEAKCEDRDERFTAGDLRSPKTCEWLLSSHKSLLEWLCVPGTNAWNVCEATCGKCDENCTDSDDALFTADGESGRDCAWLGDTPNMQAQLCVADEVAYSMCKRTCGSCGEIERLQVYDEIEKTFLRVPPIRKEREP